MDPTKIPVKEIIEEWRAQSKRGRYEGAQWGAEAMAQLLGGGAWRGAQARALAREGLAAAEEAPMAAEALVAAVAVVTGVAVLVRMTLSLTMQLLVACSDGLAGMPCGAARARCACCGRALGAWGRSLKQSNNQT